MTTLSTHVLDTSIGKPAQGIKVTLEHQGTILATGVTDADGRIRALTPQGTALGAGTYQLSFSVGEYFSATQRKSFYPEIVIQLSLGEEPHYHVPLLVSPFGYTTYRGS